MKDNLPYNVIPFEGLGYCFFRKLGFREPKQSEYYLSGAIVGAYKAPNDLTVRYQVVQPFAKAVQVTVWQQDELI